jgi:hypothetical protein
MDLFKFLWKDIDNLPKYYSNSKWILRFVLFIYVVITQLPVILMFDFSNAYFYLAVIYLSIVSLIILTGTLKSSSYTRLAGVLLTVVVSTHIIGLIIVRKGFDDAIPPILLVFGIGIYFSTCSNRYDFYKMKKKPKEASDIAIED